MARKRMEGTALSSWDQVDKALADIGKLDREIGLIESAGNEAIDKIKAGLKEKVELLATRKDGLELAIKDYCDSNLAEFAKVKTRQLTFGSVGYRLSTKVVIKRAADTLAALKSLNLTACIRIKEEIDKEAMKDLPTETLAEVGAGLKTDNTFGYEINRAKIAEES